MKKYSTKKISSSFYYKPEEIVKLLEIHPNTIYRWLKSGLNSSAGTSLILGKELKSFIRKNSRSKKVSIKEFEFYCPRCKSATTSKTSSLEFIETEKVLGENIKQIIIVGKCIKCNCRLNRFGSSASVEKFKLHFEKVV